MTRTERVVWSLLASSAIMVGCTGSDGGTTATTNDNTTAVESTAAANTDTTTTAAPDSSPTTSGAPTTNAPTTLPTVPPTTATASTAPATTAPATLTTLEPVDSAQAEVVATLADFYRATDRCLEAPDTCDLDAILAEYTQPNTQIAEYRAFELDYVRSNGLVVEKPDAIERTVVEVSVSDPDRASTRVCERNAAILVSYNDGVRTVENEAVAFFAREFQWKQIEGRWFITESSQSGGEEPAEARECGFTG